MADQAPYGRGGFLEGWVHFIKYTVLPTLFFVGLVWLLKEIGWIR